MGKVVRVSSSVSLVRRDGTIRQRRGGDTDAKRGDALKWAFDRHEAGETIRWTGGNYELDEALAGVKDEVTLDGPGDGGLIKLADSLNGVAVNGVITNANYAGGNTGIKIRGVRIDGNGGETGAITSAKQKAFLLRNVSDFLIDDCRAQHFGRENEPSCQAFLIEGCTRGVITRNRWFDVVDGINTDDYDGTPCSYLIVTHNIGTSTNRDFHLLIRNCVDSEFAFNLLMGSAQHSIYLQTGAHRNKIVLNRMPNGALYAIRVHDDNTPGVDGPSNNEIRLNWARNHAYGIVLQSNAGTDNKFYDNDMYGCASQESGDVVSESWPPQSGTVFERNLQQNSSVATFTAAGISSPALTGTPTTPTASAGTNTTQIASCAFVTGAISDLVGTAPGVLNTLGEIADALNDDANVYATLVTSIATKAGLADANSFTNLNTFALPTSTISSGTANGLIINRTYQQTGTAGSADIAINRTHTSVGSGNQHFFDFKVGSTSWARLQTNGLFVSGVGGFRACGGSDTNSTWHVTLSHNNTNALLTSAGGPTNGGGLIYNAASNTSTSGSNVGFSITRTYNQASGTAANTDLHINRTETAIGSGNQYLIDAQVGGTSKFTVDRTGVAVNETSVYYEAISSGTQPNISDVADTVITFTGGSPTQPSITLAVAGRYIVFAQVEINEANAAEGWIAIIRLRKTSGTPANVTGANVQLQNAQGGISGDETHYWYGAIMTTYLATANDVLTLTAQLTSGTSDATKKIRSARIFAVRVGSS